MILGSVAEAVVVLMVGVERPGCGESVEEGSLRMISSSTSWRLASTWLRLVVRSWCWDSSVARAVRLEERRDSRELMRARRVRMVSETAPSAFARDLRRPLSLAACTGGGGGEVLVGSMSVLKSVVIAVIVVLVSADEDLVRAFCRGTRGCSSGGADEESGLVRLPPPNRGLLPATRFLSISRYVRLRLKGNY